jgi:D-sedoheptulose 7-phosphate isomerase
MILLPARALARRWVFSCPTVGVDSRNHFHETKVRHTLIINDGRPVVVDEFLHDTCRLLNALDRGAIVKAKEMLLQCYRDGGRVYTAGNGGSASTAQHFACDLAKYVIPLGARPFDTRCLTDNISLYTAWANDADRHDVFVHQLRGLVTNRDVLLVVSVHGGTGYSADLVRAVRYAKEVGALTIALVGFDGGILHQEATCSIRVPVDSTPHTEGIHLVVEHCLMFLLKYDLANDRITSDRPQE